MLRFVLLKYIISVIVFYISIWYLLGLYLKCACCIFIIALKVIELYLKLYLPKSLQPLQSLAYSVFPKDFFYARGRND